MNSQAYKDEVQPAEKAPADVEHTNGAFQVPPPHKKSIAYKVLFTLAFVCFGVGLLSYGNNPSFSGELEGMWTIMIITFAFVSGVVLFLIGLLFYPIDKKSR